MRKRPWPSIHDGEDEDDREKMGTTEGRDAGNGGGVGEKERWKNVGTWIGPLSSGPIFGTGGDGARSCFTFFVKLRPLLEHFLSPKALYLKIGLWLRPLLELLLHIKT